LKKGTYFAKIRVQAFHKFALVESVQFPQQTICTGTTLMLLFRSKMKECQTDMALGGITIAEDALQSDI
jgi:hypothetical protein